MQFAIDLISDLHLETWPEIFDFKHLVTSPFCIVAGDICRNRNTVIQTLKHLGSCYQAVFYIDGNEEHKDYYTCMSKSYLDLVHQIQQLPNVVYLQDNVAVIDGVAIIGTNGWWSFDFDLTVDPTQSQQWFQEQTGVNSDTVNYIKKCSTNDALYMINSIKRLQTHMDVKKIIVVTHTVPRRDLIEHDPTVANQYKFNCMGNKFISDALKVDTENKIHTWCFGHYHGKIDQCLDNVRWVNNCRGRQDTDWKQWVYHPLRIEIDV